MDTPRIAPVPPEEWDGETTEQLGRMLTAADGRPLNIFATFAHHPKLLKRWLVFAAHVLSKSELPERDRELLILRTGWRCRAPYEWGQHVEISRRAGIGDGEIARVAQGPDAPGWDPFDAALLRAADELHDSGTIGDATWDALAGRYDTRQLLEVPFTVGQYHLVAFALNACRVPLDAGVEGLPGEPAGARLAAVEIPVGDLAGAARGYGYLLGVEGRDRAPERHDLHLGGATLTLVATPTPGGSTVHLEVDDVPAVRARAAAAGFAADPSGLLDTWGNAVVLVERAR